MNTVEIENLRHQYTKKDGGTQFAVDDVSFDIAQGEFFVLLGPSGCGKTTTLRCIAGLERPTSGTIRLNEKPVVSRRRFVPTNQRDIGMVFQDYAVWPHMTVFDNVAFPLTVGPKVPKAEIKSRVDAVLDLVRLGHLADRHSTQLSGGQQQRISLARALVRRPSALLLDEPLSNLDAALRENMRAELRQIQRQVDVTAVLVTHDQAEALSMATRIALMREGRVEQIATPRELYERPASRFVAEFIGTGTFYDGKVVTADAGGDCVLDTPLGKVAATARRPVTVGESVTLLVRPEHATVHAEGPARANEFDGIVRNALYLGDSVDLHIEAGGQVLRAAVPAHEGTYDVGDGVVVGIPAAHAMVIAS